jgi:DNA repair exonuclease SbcCD ATPase subunit
MDNQYINFWQNSLTDIFDKSTQFKQMDKLFEQSLSSIGEFTSMVQKMGRWDLFFKPMESSSMFDFKKNMDDYLKLMGLISIDEYRSLVNKYDELKKENEKLEKTYDDQKKKISELNQASTNEKKKSASSDKSNEDNVKKLDEQKKISENLTKELANEKKKLVSLEKELNDIKKLADSLKKEITEKENALNKIQTKKA